MAVTVTEGAEWKLAPHSPTPDNRPAPAPDKGYIMVHAILRCPKVGSNPINKYRIQIKHMTWILM